jgi:uncharacterized membrane protein YidH (DUF202 family)
LNAQESRVNVLMRLVGLVFLVMGVAMTWLTYSEASQANIVPQILPVFYLVSILLVIVGLVAMLANYK